MNLNNNFIVKIKPLKFYTDENFLDNPINISKGNVYEDGKGRLFITQSCQNNRTDLYEVWY